MAGNVKERTLNTYDFNLESGVIRGGSWRSTPRYVRASSRDFADRRFASDSPGFRCAE
jgi:formylglycine-generating enzyme required for sulfatase activity